MNLLEFLFCLPIGRASDDADHYGDAIRRSKFFMLGPLLLSASEYKAPMRDGSGEPLSVDWSVWLTKKAKRSPLDRTINSYWGFGSVTPWPMPYHLEFQIFDSKTEKPLIPKSTSQTGHLNFLEPLQCEGFPVVRVTNRAPATYRYGQQHIPIETPASGQIILSATDEQGENRVFAYKLTVLQCGGETDLLPHLGSSTYTRARTIGALVSQTAARISGLEGTDLNLYTNVKITSLAWILRPFGFSREQRLYGRPEWFAEEQQRPE